MKRMLIDVTTIESTKVLAIVEVRRLVVMAGTRKLMGIETTGYPVELWAFERIDKLALQYLLWNTFQEPPPEDYKDLAKRCLELVDAMPEDNTPLKDLEATYKSMEASVTIDAPDNGASQRKKVTSKSKEQGRPRTGSTTGAVWDICDEQSAKLGHQVDRKAAIEACGSEGINRATASTQYGKWKKFTASKNIENKA